MPTERDVWLTCTNWKGETERRHIRPATLRFGDAPPWHTERQWLLDAFDLERNGVARTFALSGIRAWAATAGGLPPPLDPALLARLETRYAHPGVPACEKCGAMLVAVPPGHGTTIPGRTLCCCPIALVGGGWAAESAVKVHYVESLRYVAHGDDDVLALVRWARGLAGEGDGVT